MPVFVLSHSLGLSPISTLSSLQTALHSSSSLAPLIKASSALCSSTIQSNPVCAWSFPAFHSPAWSIIRQLRGEERSEMIDFLDDSELQCCWEDGCEDVDGGGWESLQGGWQGDQHGGHRPTREYACTVGDRGFGKCLSTTFSTLHSSSSLSSLGKINFKSFHQKYVPSLPS